MIADSLKFRLETFVTTATLLMRLLRHVALGCLAAALWFGLPGLLQADDLPASHVGVRFLASSECALCHSFSSNAQALRDSKNRNVAPVDLWSGSMMANSSRDPYWRAVLSAEIATTPSQKALLESICTRCHAPMAAPVVTSPDGTILAILENNNTKHSLAIDGVSCTVCHQISPEKLGTDESFTGAFVLNKENKIYGPHADPVTMPMQRHVGYTPTQSNHVTTSAMCATCHTVITESVDLGGEPTGVLLHEQAPYLEWRNSIFNDETNQNQPTAKSCQNCHMPTADVDGTTIATRLAHNPAGRDFPFLKPREPFGRHTFAGGNTFMAKLIRDNRKSLQVSASKESLDQTIVESRKLLTEDTARLTISHQGSSENETQLTVKVENLAGHKFPTAYPSRRAWLELVVRDKSNNIVFSSGTSNESGQLTDQAGRILPQESSGGPTFSHFSLIKSAEQVQVYETQLLDSEGHSTYSLLRASKFGKDNRLLPKGWSLEHRHAEATAAVGTSDDSDFLSGEDSTGYQLQLPQGKYKVRVRLQFQSLSARYVSELFKQDTKEVRAFREMYQKADKAPETIDTVEYEFSVL